MTQKADTGRWNGLGRYDSNFADLFGEYARIYQPAQPSDASCTECHRFGRGPKTDAACAVYTRRYTGQPEFSTNPHEVLMPRPGILHSGWHSGYDTALAQIQRCCANPDLAECQSRLADGAPPP